MTIQAEDAQIFSAIAKLRAVLRERLERMLSVRSSGRFPEQAPLDRSQVTMAEIGATPSRSRIRDSA
jgi:hypothetical protein